MKKTITLICMTILILSMSISSVFAAEIVSVPETSAAAIITDTETTEIAPRITIGYVKTVTKSFPNLNIPTSIYYEEYSDEYKTWCKGMLYRIGSITPGGEGYIATYRGTLNGTI